MVHISKIAVRGAAILAAATVSGGLFVASLAIPATASTRHKGVASVQAYSPCTRTLIDHCQQDRHSPRPDARHEAALVRQQQEVAS